MRAAFAGLMLGIAACAPSPALDDRTICARLQTAMPVPFLRSRTDAKTVANVFRLNVRFHAACTAKSSDDRRSVCQVLRADMPVEYNAGTTDAVTLHGIRAANVRFAMVCPEWRS
ncbi:MAG: hypothetical protein Q8M19_17195 [Reyranella sp.]|nr:hypothetical protein [Reyranella sp.]